MRPTKIIFAGSPPLAAVIAEALFCTPNYTLVGVYTQPDRPAGRGRALTASAVKQWALQHKIPVFQPQTLKTPEAQAELAALNADIMIVAAYGILLPPAVLNLFRFGCLNVHFSLLPRWRGASPMQHAIASGDSITGITIIQMDAGCDTGPVLLQEKTDVLPEETAAQLESRLAELGARTLLKALGPWLAGQLTPQAQNPSQVTLAPKIKKEEGHIDWQQPAIQIVRRIRAFNPWPVCFSEVAGTVIRIWRAEVIKGISFSSLDALGELAVPGAVIALHAKGIDVLTGDGVLRILQLQLPGGKPQEAAAFLNAKPKWLVPGVRWC